MPESGHVKPLSSIEGKSLHASRGVGTVDDVKCLARTHGLAQQGRYVRGNIPWQMPKVCLLRGERGHGRRYGEYPAGDYMFALGDVLYML